METFTQWRGVYTSSAQTPAARSLAMTESQEPRDRGAASEERASSIEHRLLIGASRGELRVEVARAPVSSALCEARSRLVSLRVRVPCSRMLHPALCVEREPCRTGPGRTLCPPRAGHSRVRWSICVSPMAAWSTSHAAKTAARSLGLTTRSLIDPPRTACETTCWPAMR